MYHLCFEGLIYVELEGWGYCLFRLSNLQISLCQNHTFTSDQPEKYLLL